MRPTNKIAEPVDAGGNTHRLAPNSDGHDLAGYHPTHRPPAVRKVGDEDVDEDHAGPSRGGVSGKSVSVHADNSGHDDVRYHHAQCAVEKRLATPEKVEVDDWGDGEDDVDDSYNTRGEE